MDLQILDNADHLARAAAEHFLRRSNEAVAQRGWFTVALSGGSTPKRLYQLLAEQFRDQIPWSGIHFYWSDERHVSPRHPESNYRMTNEAMLSRVPVSPANVHRVFTENPAADAARDYEDTIVKQMGGNPRLDLILLGLGADGHTASIFPGSEVLRETKRLVAAPWVEKLKTHRITMTLALLNNGASVVFLVSGAEKAQIVKEVLEGPEKYPAQAVKPVNGELLWLLDQEAAGNLTTMALRRKL